MDLERLDHLAKCDDPKEYNKPVPMQVHYIRSAIIRLPVLTRSICRHRWMLSTSFYEQGCPTALLAGTSDMFHDLRSRCRARLQHYISPADDNLKVSGIAGWIFCEHLQGMEYRRLRPRDSRYLLHWAQEPNRSKVLMRLISSSYSMHAKHVRLVNVAIGSWVFLADSACKGARPESHSESSSRSQMNRLSRSVPVPVAGHAALSSTMVTVEVKVSNTSPWKGLPAA